MEMEQRLGQPERKYPRVKRALTVTVRRISVVSGLMVTAGSFVLAYSMSTVGTCLAIAAQQPPEVSSVDELEPEVRNRFLAAKAKWDEAVEQYHQALERAYKEDPLLLKAKDLRAKAKNVNRDANAEIKVFRDRLERQHPDSVDDFEDWENRYRYLVKGEAWSRFVSDPETRPFAAWMIHTALFDRREQLPEEIRRELPLAPSEISLEQALEIMLKLHQPEPDRIDDRRRLDELAQKLKHLDLPREAAKRALS